MHESEWIALAKQGSREAFAQLVRLHHGRVRAFLSRYVHDDDIADDIAQEVFFNVHRAIPSYQHETGFAAWLIVVARNEALSYLRGEERRRARESSRAATQLARWRAEKLDTSGWDASREDRRISALQECVKGLPAHSAAFVEQHYYRGLKAAEIAAQTGRGEGVVRMTLLRIR